MMEHNQGSKSVDPRSPSEEKLVSILEQYTTTRKISSTMTPEGDKMVFTHEYLTSRAGELKGE